MLRLFAVQHLEMWPSLPNQLLFKCLVILVDVIGYFFLEV